MVVKHCAVTDCIFVCNGCSHSATGRSVQDFGVAFCSSFAARILHFDLQLAFIVLAIQDPLFRFFEREVKMGAKLLQDVRQDLADVVQVCEGKKKQTNYLRTLINELVKGMVNQISIFPCSLCLLCSVSCYA